MNTDEISNTYYLIDKKDLVTAANMMVSDIIDFNNPEFANNHLRREVLTQIEPKDNPTFTELTYDDYLELFGSTTGTNYEVPDIYKNTQ